MIDVDSRNKIIRTPNGYLYVPFMRGTLLIKGLRPKLSKSEIRAYTNIVQFPRSLIINLSRLKNNLTKYKSDSLVGIELDKLYFDLQCCIILIRKFFEEVTIILRSTFPISEKEQLPPNFSKFLKIIYKDHPWDDPFIDFLIDEHDWFKNIKDMRDDILHTTLDRQRSSLFPGLIDILKSFGSLKPFPPNLEINEFLKTLVFKILVFSVLAECFYKNRIVNFSNEESFIMRVQIYIAEFDQIFPSSNSEVFEYFLNVKS